MVKLQKFLEPAELVEPLKPNLYSTVPRECDRAGSFGMEHYNRPLYSCLLSDLVSEWQRGSR